MDTFETNDQTAEVTRKPVFDMPEPITPTPPADKEQPAPQSPYPPVQRAEQSPEPPQNPQWRHTPSYQTPPVGWYPPGPQYGGMPYYAAPPQYGRQVPPVTPPPQHPDSRPAASQKGGFGKVLLSGALVLALVIGSCSITASVVNNRWKKENRNLSAALNDKISILEKQIQERPNTSTGDSVSGSPNTNPLGGLTPAQVYAQNVQSVVAIACTNLTSTSSGSGFVYTEDGYIISNYHVVEGATEIKVIFSDETSYKATMIGGDASNDIALLKIEATGLRPAVIGDSDALVVGDQVAAIGNPLGELASTLTVGYISAKDRIITTDGTQINMLQTDASINPGNSGGPLFNMNGEVIGITTAKYSGTTSSGASIEGIGFAIPMNDVTGMFEDLREHGYITGGFLGVTVTDVSKTDSQLYGLPMGVLVHEVVSGSCSEAAGVRPQDIITQLGGYDIENTNDLTRAMRHFKPGDTISMVVYRHSDGGEVYLSVTLDAKPQASATAPAESTPPANGSVDDWFDHFFG